MIKTYESITYRLEVSHDNGIVWHSLGNVNGYISPKKAIAAHKSTPYGKFDTNKKYRIVECKHITVETVIDFNIE